MDSLSLLQYILEKDLSFVSGTCTVSLFVSVNGVISQVFVPYYSKGFRVTCYLLLLTLRRLRCYQTLIYVRMWLRSLLFQWPVSTVVGLLRLLLALNGLSRWTYTHCKMTGHARHDNQVVDKHSDLHILVHARLTCLLLCPLWLTYDVSWQNRHRRSNWST